MERVERPKPLTILGYLSLCGAFPFIFYWIMNMLHAPSEVLYFQFLLDIFYFSHANGYFWHALDLQLFDYALYFRMGFYLIIAFGLFERRVWTPYVASIPALLFIATFGIYNFSYPVSFTIIRYFHITLYVIILLYLWTTAFKFSRKSITDVEG